MSKWRCPIRIWDIPSQEIRRKIRPRKAKPGAPQVLAVQFLGQGKRFAVWYRDPPALIISGVDSNTEQRVVRLNDVGGAGVFSLSGRFFAMSVVGRGVVVWDVDEGKEKHVLRHEKAFSIAFDPDGQRIATGGDDNKVRLWDVATGTELLVLEGHGQGAVFLPPGVYSLAFGADGTLLASGGHDGRVKVWDAASGKVLFEAAVATKPIVMSVAFSPDSRLLAAAYLGVGVERGLCIWKLPSLLRAVPRQRPSE